jgi:serine/threonine-protein kinase HipA
MRKAKVLFKDEEAGTLIQQDNGSFIFRYHTSWMIDIAKSDVSLTLPKSQQEYHSDFLFPFFYNMLPEGPNRKVVCQLNKIDEDDDFGLLMIVAKDDSIGAVRISKIEEE